MFEQAAPRGVSVVIPTINRAEVLLDTIRDLMQQDFDDWELIVVDQSDEPNCAALELLRDCPVPARYFKAQFRGLPQARNFGWHHARKDIVLYIDDDIRCSPEFVRAHQTAHTRTGAAMVGGGIEEARGNPTTAGAPGSLNWWTATSIRNFHFKDGAWCLHAPGGNFSIRRDTLRAVHGFDEILAIGAALYEETEFALRLKQAGYRAWFAPDAHLLHLAAPAGGCRVQSDWPRYMRGLAHNRAILIFRHLRWWHRPTALLRLLMLGLSYSRLDRSLRPLKATLAGLIAGRRAAMLPPLNADLLATECTTC
jgi:glycosyltransferase involved in cell wall biosynthesis